MPPKRKSAASTASSDLPAKRTRRGSSSAPPAKKPETEAPPTPAGEKRGRGRPRKNPEAAPPKPATPGPKRGRGRPPKDPADRATPKATPKITTPDGVRRGRGRPKKNPAPAAPNGVDGPSDSKDEQEQPAESESAVGEQDLEAARGGSGYWLMKAEPESRFEKGVDVKFSIDDLQAATEPEPWDGVRNVVARNHMRAMKKGDLAFFYHSNCKVPGIAGYMEIVQEHSPDESAFDPAHPYYDENSSRDNPKWSVVHVEFRRKFNNLITLNDLKSYATEGGPLENLQTLKQSRLSVSNVTPEQWEFIIGLADDQEKHREASEGDSKGDGYISASEDHGATSDHQEELGTGA
ncbi:AT DNA binding protein [Aspergillus sclerotialis]|uniref:Thymocyte nuclear protein 1 n=1 Tax=Aspergillus sclerotialis TaxID=2070753 RepID=A0A3A2Z7C6_9EURO|nr:AT DNA binding protein [Aspergillus sclerotialis]